MPASDSGTYITYPNANTRISGDSSRSVCASFRVSTENIDNILVSIGSSDTTWDNRKGCNRNFALAIADSTSVTIYGMCTEFDNFNIYVGPGTLYDGMFHQICVTYNNINSKLCVYRDLQGPTCVTRTNAPYNTGFGDVRIGWWPDNNRQFTATNGGLIKSVSLYDSMISQDCVAHQINTNN
jgi:hypothetical protein